MGELARSFEANDQQNANLVNPRLYYRPYIKWAYYGGLATAGLFTIPAISAAGVLTLQGKFLAALLAFAALSILPAILFLEFWFLYRPLVHSSIELGREMLVVHRLGKRIEIPFSSIKVIKTSTLTYFGGWFKIESEGKPLRFTVVLESAHKVLDAIEGARPELGTPGTESFRKTSGYCDHQFERITASMKAWPIFLIKYLAWPLAIYGMALAGNDGHSPNLLVLLVLNAVAGYCLFALKEILLARNFQKAYQPGQVSPRNVAYERMLDARANAVFWSFSAGAYGIYLLKISSWI
jgi:hypothetical protein